MKRFYSLILLAAIVLSACTRRPLEEEWERGDYADILLVTDWQLLEETPTGITAIFYPVDGGEAISVISNNTKQNVIRLRKGKYRMLVFNQSVYEFGSMTFAGMDAFHTACASLTPLSPNSTITSADYRWLASMLSSPDSVALGMREPEPFNADRLEYEVTAEMCRLQYEKEQRGIVGDQGWDIPEHEEYIDTIFSTPPPVPPTLNVKVRVKGINNAYQVKAYMTNMARSDLFGPHLNTEEPAIHVLGQWAIHTDPGDKTRGEVTSSIRCFGVPNMQVSDIMEMEWGARSNSRAISLDYGDNVLVLDFMLRDATHRYFDFTVTDDIEYDKEELILNLDLEVGAGEEGFPIVLPDVPDIIGDGGAGFNATVEDWKHEDHNINF